MELQNKSTIEEKIYELLNEISQYKSKDEIEEFMLLIDQIDNLEDIIKNVNKKDLEIDYKLYYNKHLLNILNRKIDFNKRQFVRNFNKNKSLYLTLTESIINFISQFDFTNFNKNYRDKIGKEECNEIVNAFYNSIGFDAEPIVKEIYNNSTINYVKDQNGDWMGLAYPTLPLNNKNIFCLDYHNLNRIETTVHEIAHIISYHKYRPNMDQYYKTTYSEYDEFLSCMMERLLLDYLLKNKLHVKDCYINFNSRYLQLYKYAKELLFETFIPNIRIDEECVCKINKEQMKKILIKRGYNLRAIKMFCNNDNNIFDSMNCIYSEIIGSKLLSDYQTNPKVMLTKLDTFMRYVVIQRNDQVISSLGFDNKALLEFKALKNEIITNQQKCLHLFK